MLPSINKGIKSYIWFFNKKFESTTPPYNIQMLNKFHRKYYTAKQQCMRNRRHFSRILLLNMKYILMLTHCIISTL